jgi:hypothetical protein
MKRNATSGINIAKTTNTPPPNATNADRHRPLPEELLVITRPST